MAVVLVGRPGVIEMNQAVPEQQGEQAQAEQGAEPWQTQLGVGRRTGHQPGQVPGLGIVGNGGSRRLGECRHGGPSFTSDGGIQSYPELTTQLNSELLNRPNCRSRISDSNHEPSIRRLTLIRNLESGIRDRFFPPSGKAAIGGLARRSRPGSVQLALADPGRPRLRASAVRWIEEARRVISSLVGTASAARIATRRWVSSLSRRAISARLNHHDRRIMSLSASSIACRYSCSASFRQCDPRARASARAATVAGVGRIAVRRRFALEDECEERLGLGHGPARGVAGRSPAGPSDSAAGLSTTRGSSNPACPSRSRCRAPHPHPEAGSGGRSHHRRIAAWRCAKTRRRSGREGLAVEPDRRLPSFPRRGAGGRSRPGSPRRG